MRRASGMAVEINGWFPSPSLHFRVARWLHNFQVRVLVTRYARRLELLEEFGRYIGAWCGASVDRERRGTWDHLDATLHRADACAKTTTSACLRYFDLVRLDQNG